MGKQVLVYGDIFNVVLHLDILMLCYAIIAKSNKKKNHTSKLHFSISGKFNIKAKQQ